MSENICHIMLRHCFLKYKLARDVTYGRQQLLLQKQVTVIGSVDLDSQIDEYHTDVANFDTSSVTVALYKDSVLLRCHYSLLQQMPTVVHSMKFLV